MNETLPPTTAPRAKKPRRTAAAAPAAVWCTGTIERAAPGAAAPRWTVTGEAGARWQARRAESCLLEPAAGDRVACLRAGADDAWVLAVLEREAGQPRLLRSAGPTRLAVDGGALEVRADSFALAARQTRVASEQAEFSGAQITLIATRIKLIGSLLSSVFDRVQHFSRHYLRRTDGVHRVSATQIDCEAGQMLRLDAEQTLINGRSLVKTRGSQIHFG